ncbi:hypothetical protein ACBI99_18135 [Nonomuraea sp. ATR24]|uniref:hypothetical protein n=1 Tax=unclassified Nonomuraea TaxID=2593643 RepID=UPI0033E33384
MGGPPALDLRLGGTAVPHEAVAIRATGLESLRDDLAGLPYAPSPEGLDRTTVARPGLGRLRDYVSRDESKGQG